MSIQGKAIGNNFVLIGEVWHSQHMNDTPGSIWIIANIEGTVLSAPCPAFKAGLTKVLQKNGMRKVLDYT